MPTAYITHSDCLRHEMGAGHPECPDRLTAIDAALRASECWPTLHCLEAPLAAAADIKRVHHAEYVDAIMARAPHEGYLRLDPDTAMNAHSLDAARRAAGAGILAVDQLLTGEAANAFCAVRPCGHHATASQPMGFCIFNNVAVAAAYALEAGGLERAAIVDFDVHHGNGTEDIFASPEWRERVLMTGFFQHPFYPHSTLSGAHNMINVPLAAGSGGEAARKVFEEHWLPAFAAFRPQIVFISAGFDAHREDLLGGMALVEEDYVWMTQGLMQVAAQHAHGRIVSMLEGGYHLGALGRSVAAHVASLAGAAQLATLAVSR